MQTEALTFRAATAILLALVLQAALVGAIRAEEPMPHGRPISYWIDELRSGSNTDRHHAAQVLREMLQLLGIEGCALLENRR